MSAGECPPGPRGRWSRRRRFNEAPACLPGNEARLRIASYRRPGFNEAPACLPGNEYLGYSEQLPDAGFNEAPACLPGNAAG